MIIGVTGLRTDPNGARVTTGAGKDAVASRLVEKHGFTRIAFADPLKRICFDVFGFTEEQLWGPSDKRNAPDFRFPRGAQEYRDAHAAKLKIAGNNANNPAVFEENMKLAKGYATEGWLTPRLAIQLLGTEWGRFCYQDVWVDYGLRVAKQLVSGGHAYDEKTGLRTLLCVDPPGTPGSMIEAKPHVVFSDVRFFNEFKALKVAGAKVVRVKRTSSAEFTYDSSHGSEMQLTTRPDEDFDYIIENDGTLGGLSLLVDRMYDVFAGKILPYDEAQKDVPPFLRKS